MLEKNTTKRNYEQHKSNMGKTSQTRNQLKKHDLPTSGLQRMSSLTRWNWNFWYVKWTITCQLWSVFFVGCLYNVYIRPLIPGSSPHSCTKQKKRKDFSEEKPINRTLDLNRECVGHMPSVTGHPGRIDVTLPRTAVWVRVVGSFVRRVKFCVYSAVNIFGLALPTTNLGIVGRWPSTALAKVYPLWPHHLGYLDLGNLDTKRINGVWRGTRSHDDIFPTTKKHQTIYCTAMNIIQHLLISCPFQPSTSKPMPIL